MTDFKFTIDARMNRLQRRLKYPLMIDVEWSGNDGKFKWYIVDCKSHMVFSAFECFEDMEEHILKHFPDENLYGVELELNEVLRNGEL